MDLDNIQRFITYAADCKTYIQQIDILELLKLEEPLSCVLVIDYLKENNLLIEENSFYRLSPLGYEVIYRYGTWEKYLQEQNRKQYQLLEFQKLEIENLKWSIRQNSWLYRSRWIPHILSVISFLISIFLFLSDNRI